MSEQSRTPENWGRGVMGESRLVGRRSFLRGAAGAVAGAGAAGTVAPELAKAAPNDHDNIGANQAGIAAPPQTAASFLAFEVTAANRGELTTLFRTLTARAAFLTAGGTPP